MPALPVEFRPWPHRLAVLTTCAVFPLIFVGAGVTSKDAGMIYPDGFYSNGYFLNPPGWLDAEATRWEHGHRLLGRVVGLMAIALAVACWKSGGAVRGLGIAVLAAIVAQGVLGWMRVDLISTRLAMVHGIGAQICLCLVAATALVTSRRWVQRSERARLRAGDTLRKLAGVTAGAVFAQLVTGAATRHFPSSVTVGSHIFLAIVVVFLAGWLCLWVCGTFPASMTAGMLGRMLGAGMVIQLFLGGASFLVVVMGASRDPLVQWLTPTVHTAVGALLLMGSVLLYLTCRRMIEAVDDEQESVTVAAVPS